MSFFSLAKCISCLKAYSGVAVFHYIHCWPFLLGNLVGYFHCLCTSVTTDQAVRKQWKISVWISDDNQLTVNSLWLFFFSHLTTSWDVYSKIQGVKDCGSILLHFPLNSSTQPSVSQLLTSVWQILRENERLSIKSCICHQDFLYY